MYPEPVESVVTGPRVSVFPSGFTTVKVIPDQPYDADGAASDIPHLSSVVSPRPIGFGMASAIAYVFIVACPCTVRFIKGIDVTTDATNTINSNVASLLL